ncbi:MAG: hypothetical protein KDJ55_04150 [Rhodobiaceae bacterium]|nr:hypothetical protein [Rhodobiaceae bacterium]MCC0060020.1 hypothetical protein [Rhodobiaceae bacterium]
MHAISVFRIVPVFVAAIALAGCILSQDALFDVAEAITPVAEGRYQEMARGENNEFETVATVTVTINGNVYTATGDDDRDPAMFTMYDGGNGLIITMVVEDGEAGYALLRAVDGELLHWAATCEVAGEIGILADFPGVEDNEGNCIMPERDTLIAFMTAYAAKVEPDYKYVPVAQ